MTREQALKVNKLLDKIESLETLHDELLDLESLYDVGDVELKEELLSIVVARLDRALKELEDM